MALIYCRRPGYARPGRHRQVDDRRAASLRPNVLRLSCKARRVRPALNYPMGRALPAPNAG
jgi:hypothetical protein